MPQDQERRSGSDGRRVYPDGGKLRRLRKQRGLTQEKLAEKLEEWSINVGEQGGLCKRTIEAAEKGAPVLLNTLRLLAKFLQVELKELVLRYSGEDVAEPSRQGRNRRPEVWTADLPTPGSPVFVGREAELGLLDQAWEDKACHIVTVVGGWGGGKSALIHQWLKRMADDDYRGAEWVVGWSFRGQGSATPGAGDNFFPRALKYFNDPDPDSGLEDGKAVRLTHRVRQHRTLLILDGLEPMQSPPTVHDEGGKITNSALRALILNLANQNDGLCIITSRFPIRELQDQTCNEPCGKVRQIRLPPLDRAAAVALLKSRNLRGPETEFARAAEAHKMHPLSLSVLAGVLERRCQRDIARWPQAAGGNPTIEQSLASLAGLLNKEEKSVMSLMAFFDGPALEGAIGALRAAPFIRGLTDGLQHLGEDEWTGVVHKLRDLQLLTEANEERPRDFDCHPEVRAYFARHLRAKPVVYRGGHRRLYEHFRKAADRGGVDDLYLAVFHGCEAGCHAEVFKELVWEKMNGGFAFKRLNGHGAGTRDWMMVLRFIPAPFDFTSLRFKGMDGQAKARLFMWAATVMFVLGRVEDAVLFAQHALNTFRKLEDWLGVCCSTAYLSWFVAASGELCHALELSSDCIDSVNRHLTSERHWKKIAMSLHACLTAYQGRFEAALAVYEAARAIECDVPEEFAAIWAILMFHYGCLLVQLRHYEAAEREGRTLIAAGQCGNPVLAFLGHQILGRMQLTRAEEQRRVQPADRKKRLEQAKKHLEQAEIQLNHCPAQDQTFVSALFIAQFHRLGGNLEAADARLRRAEEAVGSFLLLKTDCLVERAWLCLLQGEAAKASEALTAARDLIDKHAYHCKDTELHNLARELKKVVLGRMKRSGKQEGPR